MDHYFTDNSNLKSELKEIEYKVFGSSFAFLSDIGVFSKTKIDFATNLLIQTYLENKKEISSALDIGCGYGVIGITLSSILNCHFDMTDINKRCIHLTEKNIKKNKVDADVFFSNAFNDINKKYDLIITNPPIRVGKEKLLEILINSKEHLNNSGELWFVINKNQGAKSIKKILDSEYLLEIVKKDKGFYIFKGKSLTY